MISVIRYIFIAAIHTWNTFWPRFNSIKSVVIIAFHANTCFVIIFFHFHSIFADISEALFWLENMSCLFRWTFQVHLSPQYYRNIYLKYVFTFPIAIGVMPSHPVILRLDIDGGWGGSVQCVPFISKFYHFVSYQSSSYASVT